MKTESTIRSPALGFTLIAIAETGIVISALLALSRHGPEIADLVVAVVVCLAFVNAGLALHIVHFRRTREASRRLHLLAEMNVQVNREILLNEDMELIYRTILDYLFKIFDTVTTGSILILGDDGYLRFAAAKGFTEDYIRDFRLKLEDSFLYQDAGGAVTETRLITQETIARLITRFDPGDWEYKSVISAPLFLGDQLFGILNLDSDRTSIFNNDDARIVERFRSQIEVGLLVRHRYRSDIERLHVDALTGLFTRRYFEDLFRNTLDRAIRHKEKFLIAIFDVDRLKFVNDKFGHLAGDRMLLSVANMLRSSCRKSDIIGRFGGDEFIAVYLTADVERLTKTIEGLLAALRETPADFAEDGFCTSFSYGFATFPGDGEDLDSLTAVADRRLYTMKSERYRSIASPPAH